MSCERCTELQMRLDAIRTQWEQYRAYLVAKYPSAPGEEWQFTCPEHRAIQAILVENRATCGSDPHD